MSAFTPPNLIESASSLLALRDQIEGRSERRERQQRDMVTQRLMGLALGGDQGMAQAAAQELQNVNPMAALKLQEAQRAKIAEDLANDQARQLNPLLREQQFQQNQLGEINVEKAQRAQEEAGYAKVRKQTEESARLFAAMEQNPAKWPELRKDAVDRGILPPSTPETFPDKAAMKSFGDRLKFMAKVTKDPKTFEAASAFGKNVQDSLALGAISQKDAQGLMRRYNEAVLAGEEAPGGGGHGGGTSVPGALTTGAAIDVQKDYAKAEVLSDSAQALTDFLPKIKEYVGARGKAAKAIGSVADYFGLVDIDQKKGESTFLDAGSLERETNNVVDQIRIITTGAAAPEAELKRIEAKLNVKMGAAEYTRALEDLLGLLGRAQATRARVLAGGVPTSPEQLKTKIDDEWYKPRKNGGGANPKNLPTLSPADFDRLDADLRKQGMSEEQIDKHVLENYSLAGGR